MALHSPFDLKQILVVDLAGSQEIFTFVIVILAGFLMAKFNFTNKESMAAFALLTVLMSFYLAGLYVIVILLTGFIVYYQIAKSSR